MTKTHEKKTHSQTTASPWPNPPAPEAYHGLAGDVVRLIEPHSEADPVALLVQTLIAFGSIVGRGPHFPVEGDRHGTNLFGVLVGITSKARKGTAWSQVKHVLEDVDRHWLDKCTPGLASGEGLIFAVRDALTRKDPIKERGRVTDYQLVIYDHGVKDKRIMVVETEFSSVLRIISRDGNTLSPTLRSAYDSGNLNNLTKNSPIKATGAHISLVGHITRDELRRYIDSTDLANGFANRFLWVCVERSKVLPDGGVLDDSELRAIRHRIHEAVAFARDVQVMKRGTIAAKLWRDVYPKLSEGHLGLLGAVTSRAEAQVVRLACVYALMDKSALVKINHLQAALALWKYCEASARYIFGDAVGDQTADELRNALRGSPNGLTHTDIRNHFSKNRPAQEIERALSLLDEYGLATKVTEDSGGRPAERWVAESEIPRRL